MIEQDLDLVVTTWLRAEAPAYAPDRVLGGALTRVATTNQERYLTQRAFGDALGRQRTLRLALAIGLIVLGVVGAALIAGALQQAPPRPTGPPANGLVAFTGNGEAGPDLSGQVRDARNGDRDIYVTSEVGGIRRIVGTDTDHFVQECPTFSPDGASLAYIEVDLTTVTPTLAPVPAGATFGPAPSDRGPVQWAIAVVGIDANGSPTGEPQRIIPRIPAGTIMSCVRWSPDGRMLAYSVDSDGADDDLWVTTLDGRQTNFNPAIGTINIGSGGMGATFDWAPDSRSIAFVDNEHVWLIPIDGGEPRPLVVEGARTVAWSPDATRLGVTTDMFLQIVTPGGGRIFGAESSDPWSQVLWSPDGAWIARVEGNAIRLDSSDGSQSATVPVDLRAVLGDSKAATRPFQLVAWSPDSQRLILSVGRQESEGSALISVSTSGDDAAILVAHTDALRGIGAEDVSWQAVR